ncbi:MAG: hypothetical protein ACAH59_00635 [Pseudobdellovibrionaceae bacterium]
MISKTYIIALCFLTAFIAYFNAIHMDFIGDDIGRILNNRTLFKSGWLTSIQSILPDRPLLTTSLWMNYQFSEFKVESYKWVSLFFHALNGFLIYLLLQKLSPALRGRWFFAILPALLFIAHPLNNQAVNSISQRGVLLSAFFTLLALWVSISASETQANKKSTGIALVLTSFGVLSKTNALITPFLILFYDRWVKQASMKEAFKKRAPLFLILLIPVFFYFILKVNSQSGAIPWWNYFLVQTRVIFLYFKLMLVPVNLKFSYLLDSSPDLFANATWLAILGHFILIVGIIFIHRRYDRVVAYCLACVYLTLLPESSFFSIRHLAFEHRAYVPLAFLVLAVGVLFGRFLERHKSKALQSALGIAGLGALAGALFLNINYNSKISNYENWVFYNLQQTPKDRAFLHFNLAEFLDRKSSRGPELAELALKLEPENKVYSLYAKIFDYKNANAQEQQVILQQIFDHLTSAEANTDRDSRLKLNSFYGRNIQNFLNGVEYWEKIDDLIFAQLPKMRLEGDYFYEIFLIFQRNTFRLADAYFQNPPKESFRFLRVLLEMKYDFDIQDARIEEKLSNFRQPSEQSTQVQDLFQCYEKQGTSPLPLVKETIN